MSERWFDDLTRTVARRGSRSERWFDDLTRTVAQRGSRRSFLTYLGLAVAGVATGGLIKPGAAKAASGCLAYCDALGVTGAAFGDCMHRCETGVIGGHCTVDSDCFHTGCSAQICASFHVITTCEWRCEYGCLAQAQCGCFGGICSFVMTPELRQCFAACG